MNARKRSGSVPGVDTGGVVVRGAGRARGAREPASEEATCGRCGVHFRTLALFDQHRHGRGEHGGCVPVTLTQDFAYADLRG